MMKLKRIGALALVLAMIAMVGAVFAEADTPITEAGKTGEELESLTTTKHRVTLVKELIISNTEGKNIYLPRVTFNYTITPVTEGNPNLTIQDEHGHEGTVYTGVNTPTITESVVFAPAGEDSNYVDETGAAVTALTQPATAATDGTSVYKGITVDFSTVAFTHAGVYRYKISETEGSDLAASGVEKQDSDEYKADRYLDVYVRMIDTDNDGLSDAPEIYGYVCFSADPANIIAKGDGANEDAMGKTNGFTGETGGHKYDTYNIEVTKVVAGTLGQKNHKFPITITMANTSDVTGALLNATDSTGTWLQGVETGGSTPYATFANAVQAGLANGEKIALYGVPTLAAATFTVTDLNDTYDVYTADMKDAEDAVVQVKLNGSGDAAETMALAKDQSAVSDTLATGDQKITVTNTLTEISPTGYVARFAPYALMLIGGIALLIVARKHRRHAEDEEK